MRSYQQMLANLMSPPELPAAKLEDKTITVGGPCTCYTGRFVRWAIPPVPGLPAGEVSCRTEDETGPASTRKHAFPADHVLARHVPRLS